MMLRMPADVSSGDKAVTAKDKQNRTNYSVKSVETVVDGTDVKARIFTLAPGEAIPWHFHRHSTDHYFVLEGLLSISTRGPDVEVLRLPVGGRYQIAPLTEHLIANGGGTDCRFLLLQGVGAYDWNAAN
jgi:mannose-6-phosphate isomerase-like protein (cupin superfamily)